LVGRRARKCRQEKRGGRASLWVIKPAAWGGWRFGAAFGEGATLGRHNWFGEWSKEGEYLEKTKTSGKKCASKRKDAKREKRVLKHLGAGKGSSHKLLRAMV